MKFRKVPDDELRELAVKNLSALYEKFCVNGTKQQRAMFKSAAYNDLWANLMMGRETFEETLLESLPEEELIT